MTSSLHLFYCDFKDTTRQKSCDLLPSFVIRLSAPSNPCCGILSHVYLTISSTTAAHKNPVKTIW